MKYHHTPVRMAKMNNTGNDRFWRGCREKATLLHCWWEHKLVQSLWKAVWRFLKKLKLELPYDAVITLLSIYQKKKKTKPKKPYIHIYVCIFYIYIYINVYMCVCKTLIQRHDRTWVGEGRRVKETESEAGSRLWAVSTEPGTGLKLMSHEIMTWAEAGHLTNWAAQAPWYWMLLESNAITKILLCIILLLRTCV